jgi:predicted hotdog family 3-hydroxylacyl-ACP dehydratase
VNTLPNRAYYVPYSHIEDARRDRFRGVDGTSASDSKYEVDTFLAAKLNAFIYETASGVGLYAAKLHKRNVRIRKGLLYSVKKSAAHHAATAVMDQNLTASKLPYQASSLLFRILAKCKIGR